MYTNRNISRVLAAAVASTGFAVVPMPTLAGTFNCAGSSFSVSPDGKGNFNVSCTTPGSSATCSLIASTTSLPASGGSITLTANNCGTVSSWAKNGSQVAQSGSTWTETIPANAGATSVSFTYTVQGDNGSDSVTVSESAAGTPPPPINNGPISCSGYSKTLVYDLAWVQGATAKTAGFGNDAIVVARFTTGPVAPGATYPANVSSIEYVDARVTRTAALSTVPCDLTGGGLGTAAADVTQGPNWTYQVGGTAPLSRFTLTQTRVVLQPNTTYYVNITNKDGSGTSTCGGSTCNMIIQLTKPQGT
jgi:hypothetical protein